jgi:hypothetical protein
MGKKAAHYKKGKENDIGSCHEYSLKKGYTAFETP